MFSNLKEVIDEKRIRRNVSMAEYTTFRTGGSASVFITPENLKELKDIIKLFYEAKQEYFILGNGSNLLVSDKGIEKPVIYIGKCFSSVDIFETSITARAGATLSSVAKRAYENSLTGFEFAAGIPGSIGGALIMNAGAYGGEMKDVVEAVSFIDPFGEEHIVSNEEMEFSYRSSALSDSGCIITGCVLSLKKGDKADILNKMNELALKRREKQPLEYPSAGSTFKRPTGYFAGALIESSGLKGMSVGGAQVSEKHAGFIINKNNATTDDICKLIEKVRDVVYEKHGVLLETEIKYWA